MNGRCLAALAAVSTLACGSDPVRVEQAPVTLARSPAEVFESHGSIAVAAVMDDGQSRTVTLSSEAQVTLRAYGATVSRAAQPSGARALSSGARVTLDVHTAITQLDASGHVVGRIENPFEGTPGRARPSAGRRLLTVLADDVTDASAWRVLEAYALDASGDALAEPALGFAAGTSVDALFAAIPAP